MEKIFNIGDRLENSWRGASRRKKIWIYIGVYTLVFLTAFLIAFSPFFQENKSFIFNTDGELQHYPAVVYVGRSIRKYISSALNGDVSVPMFDLGVNLGGDIIGNLNGNADTDPLLVLSALVPTVYSEYLYCFLGVFRLWLAGISFFYLCTYFNKRVLYSLIGSIIYCLSAYGSMSVARHPQYINAMVQLPLLIVGTDKIINRERPFVFVAALFYSAICGYYHVYQMTIMVLIYALIRVFDIYKEKRFREFILAACRGLFSYVLGIGLASIVLLPSIINFLNCARNGHSTYYPTQYSLIYFIRRIALMISPSASATWGHLGMAAIVLLAVALLSAQKKRKSLKILLVIGVFFWCSNIGGFIMHGFQYPLNRWIYGLVLLLSFVVVEMLPDLMEWSIKHRIICMITLCLFVIITFAGNAERQIKYILVGLAFLSLTCVALSCFTVATDSSRKAIRIFGYENRLLRAGVCLLLVIVNVGVNGIYRNAADQGNYIKNVQDLGVSSDRLLNSAERTIQPWLADNPEGRADSTQFTANMEDVWFVPDLLYYDSVIDKNLIEFFDETENKTSAMSFFRKSSDQRTLTNALLSVKYHIESENRTQYIPFGYEPFRDVDNDVTIYKNQYALPWGYTYDSSLTYEELEKFNGLQKQEAMLQAVAIENTGTSKIMDDIVLDEYPILYNIVFDKCTYENDVLNVEDKNAVITLNFDMPAGVEGYLRLPNFNIEGSGIKSFLVTVSCDDITKQEVAYSELYDKYDGKTDYLFNLGYSEDERHELTITFPTKGTFKLDDIELYALPMDNYPARVEALRAEPLENIQWGTNSLTGTVDLSKDKILCVSVPYSKGWTATVDGMEVEILRGNYMFMCIPLTGGYHEIEFHYCSPGLKLGAALTCCSAAVLACMYVCDRKRRRQVK